MKNLKLVCQVCFAILVISFSTSCQTEEITEVEETSEELTIFEKTNSTTSKAATTQVVRTRFRSATSLSHLRQYKVSRSVIRGLEVRTSNDLYWKNRNNLNSYKNYCKIKWQEYRANGQAFCNSIWGNNSAQKAACRLYYTEIAENEIRTTCRR